MESKETYTPVEVAGICKAYTSYLEARERGADRKNARPYSEEEFEEISSWVDRETDDIRNSIPGNVLVLL